MVSIEQENASIQLFLNDCPISITASSSLINRLQTDDKFLGHYISKVVKAKQISFLDDSNLSTLRVRRALITCNENFSQKKLTPVWFSRKANDRDEEATKKLIELRCIKYKDDFLKKTSRKKTDLWNKIAEELRQDGFDVRESQCSQKFRNMCKKFFIELKEELRGNRRYTFSPYYEQLREICRYKINPEWLSNINNDVEKNENSQDFSDSPPNKKRKHEQEIIYVEWPQDLECVANLAGTTDNSLIEVINNSNSRSSDETNPIKTEVESLEDVQEDRARNVDTQSNEPSLMNQQFNRLFHLLEERNRQNERLVSAFERIADKFENL